MGKGTIMINFKYNRLGGIDCEKDGMPYTLTQTEIDELAEDTEIAEFDQKAYEDAVSKSEKLRELSESKLEAFTFKDVVCSVKEEDQNGLEVINSYINDQLADGAEWEPIPFVMENGNAVTLETHDEWKEFRKELWSHRKRIMMEKASLL